MADYLQKIRKIFGVPKNSLITNLSNPNNALDTPITMSSDELKKHYSDIYVSDVKSVNSERASILSYIDPIKSALLKNKIDDTKLFSIAPEIENASAILIPSILSPNNLKVISALNFMINDETIKPSIKSDIISILDDHFNNKLKLYSKLSKWIEAALIKYGATPLMIIPNEIIKKIKESSIVAVGEENLSSAINKMLKDNNSYNIFGQNDFSYSTEDLKIDTINNEMREFALEALNDLPSDLFLNSNGKKKASDILKKKTFISVEGLSAAFTKLKEDDAFIVSSNINIIGMNKIARRNSINHIENEFQNFIEGKESKAQYKNESFVDMSMFLSDSNNNESDYPILEELPYESVIPIHMKNTPEEHIGYFILMDSEGYPIKGELKNTETNAYGTNEIDRLYKTMKTDSSVGKIFTSPRLSQSNFEEKVKKEAVSRVINSYVDITLRKKLNYAGMVSVDVKLNNDVQSLMLSRLLKKKKTILLFVPKSIMFYMAFKYNNNGTGQSKIENIKFPLSLKMTFMITKLIGLIDASINRKRVEVELDEENSINHLEILRAIKNRLIQNKLSGFSYDPSKIIQSIAEKEISMVPKNLPGVTSFNISEEQKQSQFPRPEDDLFTEINNMYIMGLDVPPSTLNQLGENEFSRSIATYNFFFSNKIMNYQSVITEIISNLIITYVKYSNVLKNNIKEILKNNFSDEEEDNDENKMTDEKLSEFTNTIIENIRITLPSPKIVYDKAQYEEVSSYIDIIEKITDNVFPDEMIADRDMQDTYKIIKSYTKIILLKQYLTDTNVSNEFMIDEIENVDIEEILNSNQIVTNLQKALNTMKKKLSSGEEESSPY